MYVMGVRMSEMLCGCYVFRLVRFSETGSGLQLVCLTDQLCAVSYRYMICIERVQQDAERLGEGRGQSSEVTLRKQTPSNI